MFTRRKFLKSGAVAAATTFIPLKGTISQAFAFSQSQRLAKFIQPLRGVGGAGIPLAVPDAVPRAWWQPGVIHYTLDMAQFEDQLHPELPNPTRLRGYGQGGAAKHRHLGGIIAVKRGTPVQISFRNRLSGNHIVPVDTTIPGAELGPNRVSPHLHGGQVPWISDGGPESWWDPAGNVGKSFAGISNPIRNRSAAPNEQEFYYPNNQGARMMWYHDHAVGTTRVNAYAGLASAYVVYDDYETVLLGSPPYNLPGPLDPRTTYLVFQDKTFVSPNVAVTDPGWFNLVSDSKPGHLWYAHTYEPERWEVGSSPTEPMPDPSVVPEFFGDTILVNGLAYPTLTVEPRQYRWRMLNASNARFFNPRLVHAQGATGVAATEPSSREGPAFVQIGTEGGFLPVPAMVNGPRQTRLLIAPGERSDLIVDFRAVPVGTVLILYSDAPAPFPFGDARYDYYPRNPKTPSAIPGAGPNTRTLLQIKVGPRVGPADPGITLPAALANNGDLPFHVRQAPGIPTAAPVGVRVRRLTLNESFDAHGRLIQRLGTDVLTSGTPRRPMFGQPYDAPPTEVVGAGSMEVWEVLNLTGDTHPMHFHEVNVQVLSRQAFSARQYAGGVPHYLGPPIAPDLNELGWKETVRMNPGEVTRVLMRFDLPAVGFTVPASARTGGNEYVWHCHILEHEEHDMMRPLVIL